MLGADPFLKGMQRNVFHAHHDKLRMPNVTEILLEIRQKAEVWCRRKRNGA